MENTTRNEIEKARLHAKPFPMKGVKIWHHGSEMMFECPFCQTRYEGEFFRPRDLSVNCSGCGALIDINGHAYKKD